MISPKKILHFLRSFQKGLLGKVTPNLRAACVVFQDDTSFELSFYYDKPLSEDEVELPNLAFAEISSDFPPPDFNSNLIVKIHPYPNKIPEDGFWLYERFEGSL